MPRRPKSRLTALSGNARARWRRGWESARGAREEMCRSAALHVQAQECPGGHRRGVNPRSERGQQHLLSAPMSAVLGGCDFRRGDGRRSRRAARAWPRGGRRRRSYKDLPPTPACKFDKSSGEIARDTIKITERAQWLQGRGMVSSQCPGSAGLISNLQCGQTKPQSALIEPSANRPAISSTKVEKTCSRPPIAPKLQTQEPSSGYTPC